MSIPLKAKLAEALSAVTGLDATIIERLLERPKNPSFGDLAIPCFSFQKSLGLSPVECAKKIQQDLVLPIGVTEILPTGPFLNFKFDRAYVTQSVLQAALADELPLSKVQERTRVTVEYSSPNIAKPFHVGHLRATLIGNALDKLYRFLGWETTSINHLGDWGTQFGFVWAGCEIWGKPETSTVASLVELYKKATALKDEQEKSGVGEGERDVQEMARAYFIALEKGEDWAVKFWREAVETSITYLERTYERLGIRFDHYLGESFYSDKLHSIETELKSAGLLIESQGALGVELGEALGFARILTPDGRSLYLTRDLAAADYRAKTFNFDKAIYVVGAPQTLHFQQLKEILRKLKKPYAEKIIHVAFGHVLGMKTRGEGQAIELNEFLDEAHARALEAYRTQVTKRPEGLDEDQVAKAVAQAALIFSQLSRTNIKDVHFSWDSALEFQGDSGPYLLYAYARINSIKERAFAAGIELAPLSQLHSSLLGEDAAYQLTLKLAEFAPCLEDMEAHAEPSILCSYALDLAKLFSKAYLELRIVGEERNLAEARLNLFVAVQKTIERSLKILGIEPLERM